MSSLAPMTPPVAPLAAPATILARSVVAGVAARRQRWIAGWDTTPGRLRALLALIILATLLTGAATYAAYDNVRQAAQTVGRDTVPSIIAALRIKARLADADEAAAAALIAGEAPDGAGWKAYAKILDGVDDDLVTAAQNITYGEAERAPLLTIDRNLAAYETLVGQAQGTTGDDRRIAFEAADTLMHQAILPAADALDSANFKPLTMIYTMHRSRLGLVAAPMIMLGLLLLAALTTTQIFLLRRTRRVINPGLAVATLLLAASAICCGWVLSSTEASLRLAKQDAFDSIHALWQARAAANDARAEERLLVLDRGRPSALYPRIAAFDRDAALLASADDRHGFLADELANITFDGEKTAALATLQSWREYRQGAVALRQLALAAPATPLSPPSDAILTAIAGTDRQFLSFDKALDTTIAINDTQFKAAIESIFETLALFPLALVATMLAVILTSMFGVKPRLDEYRF